MGQTFQVVGAAYYLLAVTTGGQVHFNHTLTSLACLAACVAFLMSGRSATVV